MIGTPAPAARAGRRPAHLRPSTSTTTGASRIVDATRTTGDAVTPADPDRTATLSFRSVDLSGAIRVEAEVAREDDGPAEACLRLWAHDLLLAEIAVPVTGSRYAWTTVSAELAAPVTGVRDLRVTLDGDIRLDSLRFGSAD